MPNLEYSDEAESVRRKFLKVDAVVYVEGDDDIPFWKKIFSTVPNFRVRVESLGGASKLDRMIDRVVSGGVEGIVARDRDYLEFSDGLVSSPFVIYTDGHSIENTLVCEKAVKGLLENYSRGKDCDFDYKGWIEYMDDCMRDVAVVDCWSFCRKKGLKVLSKGCQEFSGNGLFVFDKNKCMTKKKELMNHVDCSEFGRLHGKMSSFPIDKILRGHFLLESVGKLIKCRLRISGKSAVIDNSSIFVALMFCLESRLSKRDSSVLGYISMANDAAINFRKYYVK